MRCYLGHLNESSLIVVQHFSELLHMCRAQQELTIAYSKEENANQEVIRHLRALLFDKRVYFNWSFEELPLVQRIMNTTEKTATGVTPAEIILNISLRLTKSIFTEPSIMDRSRLKSMSGQLGSWISRQAILLKVTQENQRLLIYIVCKRMMITMLTIR